MQSYVDLHNLYKYFKKAVNTRLSADLLKSKEKSDNALKGDIESHLQTECSSIPDAEFHSIAKNARYWNYEVQRIINHKLELLNLHTTVHKHTKFLGGIAKTTIAYERKSRLKTQNSVNKTMANEAPAFDMKQATAIVPVYDGAPDDLDAFLDAINLLSEVTAANQAATAVKFVKTRLTKRARLGLPNNLATLQDIANDLKTRCKSQDNPESIVAKLKQIRKKSSTAEFCDEVENLTLKLKNLYMEQQIPCNVANSMATKAGLESLINGISSNETKLILKAGNFPSIKDAILKVNENDNNGPQILFTQTRQPQNRFANNNNNNNRNNGNHPHYYRSNHYHGRSNYFRGNGGQRPYNNNASRNDRRQLNQPNNINTNPQRQQYQRHRGNQNNQHYRRVYTGAATSLYAAPYVNMNHMYASGMQSAPPAQNVMSATIPNSAPAVIADQLVPYTMQQGPNNFLGQLPNPCQPMQ